MSATAIKTARALALQYASSQQSGPGETFVDGLKDFIADDAAWNISCPIDAVAGRAALIEAFWTPLLASFPDLGRRVDIMLAGVFRGGAWAASTGYFVGTFEKDWLGIPSNDQAAFIRYGEILEITDDRIERGFLLLDLVGLARQAGTDLIPRSRGAEILPPAPRDQDGVRREAGPPEETARSMALVEDMAAGLLRYDGESLDSMGQHRFWSPDMMWYGPSGIGTARGLGGFQRYHQRPFLDFVPDRVGGNHFARIADGPYVASGGWPSIYATTSGAPWISTALPAGEKISMRVMDFWRREGGRLSENWVLIDIPDVFRQCGVDVFAGLRGS